MIKKNSYKYEELIDCAEGKLFGPGNAKLPLPPMLMFDRITEINNDQGLFKRLMSEDNPNLKPGDDKKPKGAGVLIGMLKYNFEIHGNSGITHGDTFNIIGIPSVYSKTGFF